MPPSSFQINHLGFSSYVGRFNNFDAKLQLDAADPRRSMVEATIVPTSVDTNNPELQDKLRGEYYFNVAQFPEIKFSSRGITLVNANSGTITGDLTMLGDHQAGYSAGDAERCRDEPYASIYTVGFTANTVIKRSDWGMKTLVPQVGDEVKVTINAEFHREQSPEGK
jgi:polyisoprenoid-binding protein YceI